MADKMTTSNDKPIPQNTTEAEFKEQEREEAAKAAVTRDEAARRLQQSQRHTIPVEQGQQPTVQQAQQQQLDAAKQNPQVGETQHRQQALGSTNPLSIDKSSTALVGLKGHFDAMAVMARDLPNSTELAELLRVIALGQEQLRLLSTNVKPA